MNVDFAEVFVVQTAVSIPLPICISTLSEHCIFRLLHYCFLALLCYWRMVIFGSTVSRIAGIWFVFSEEAVG